MSQIGEAARARPQSRRGEADDPAPTAPARLADAVLIVAFLALTFLLGIFPLKDTDFWWHLKAGDQIRQTGLIPTEDTFTFGAQGHRWVDLHWVFQVLVSWGYAHGGVPALNLAKCAITTLAVALLIGSRRRGWPTWVTLLAWLPALLVLNGRMYIRPETLSLLYLAAVLAILFRWERAPWLAFALPVVQACWVNTQGLFLLEPILIGFALLDAATRPGALGKARRGWWRVVGPATALTGLACLLNPYGLAGALYPIELAGTMSNSIFKDTIGELKPLPKFIEEVGLDSLPLRLHLLTFVLGVASFLLPLAWRARVALAERSWKPEAAVALPKGRKKRESTRARKQAGDEFAAAADSWRPSVFRGLMFASFSALSLAATRNSHQFAAVVGTVTAWNFAEWAGAVRARRLRLDPDARPPGRWPRVATFAVLALTFAAVASGRFYAWSGEGRTVGLGEEPLWYPHDAIKLLGKPGMPDRLVGFHNGHPALYEYRYAPAKKAYADARLEVMGADLYKRYLDLSDKIARDAPGWGQELEEMGRPAVLVDNLDQGNASLSATLLKARRWRCVWFDPIACVFVHESYAQVARDDAIDFDARHFRREADASREGAPALAATARALRFVGHQLRLRAGGEERAQALLGLGLDYARKLRAIAPGDLDGWKQAGLIEYVRDAFGATEPIPRFRLPFDPVFDLPLARATYDLTRALGVEPDDGPTLFYLADLYQKRGMFDAAEPLLARYADQPNLNLSQQRAKAGAADQLAVLKARLGPSPSTKWANLSELDRVVAGLMASGRALELCRVMEAAYRPEARPWEWADRLAVLRLHLGEPLMARTAWLSATEGAPAAPRLARIAATYLVEGNFDFARKFYREAIVADPGSFEAHYGLASLERDAGHAAEAAEHARLAERAAATPHARTAARSIVEEAAPYAAGPDAAPRQPPAKEPSR